MGIFNNKQDQNDLISEHSFNEQQGPPRFSDVIQTVHPTLQAL